MKNENTISYILKNGIHLAFIFHFNLINNREPLHHLNSTGKPNIHHFRLILANIVCQPKMSTPPALKLFAELSLSLSSTVSVSTLSSLSPIFLPLHPQSSSFRMYALHLSFCLSLRLSLFANLLCHRRVGRCLSLALISLSRAPHALVIIFTSDFVYTHKTVCGLRAVPCSVCVSSPGRAPGRAGRRFARYAGWRVWPAGIFSTM